MFATYAWVVVKYFNFGKSDICLFDSPFFARYGSISAWLFIHILLCFISSRVCVHICTFGWKTASSCTLLWATVCIYLSPICSFQWDISSMCYKQSHGVIWENSVLLFSNNCESILFLQYNSDQRFLQIENALLPPQDKHWKQ